MSRFPRTVLGTVCLPWTETGTLDAPQALPNYVARGFRPYRTDTEVIETIE